MIEIVNTQIINDPAGQPMARHTEIIITSGPSSYLYSVGGLPLSGSLQAVLDAREGELFGLAQASGKAVDLYEVAIKKVLKAFALVVMDEINILRLASVPPLPVRTAAMIESALKNKMKGL